MLLPVTLNLPSALQAAVQFAKISRGACMQIELSGMCVACTAYQLLYRMTGHQSSSKSFTVELCQLPAWRHVENLL